MVEQELKQLESEATDEELTLMLNAVSAELKK